MSVHAEDNLTQLRFTTQDVVDLIYETLECLHKVLVNNDIPYTVFGGTALGAERHGGLIPWDDDADLAILADNEQRLVGLSETFATHGYVLRQESFFGYRLYHATSAKPRALDQYPYPFVDIFLLKDTGSSYEYTTECARKYWPQTPLPYACFDRLTDIKFGHLTLRGLAEKDMKEHLDDNYGKDWSYMAWREFDHFYYENVTDSRVKLQGRKAHRPAQHSNHQRTARLLQPVVNHNM